MRLKKAGKRLGRKMEERKALARNLTLALFERFGNDEEFIQTSRTKAKWVKPFAEKCITIGIKGFKELQAAADANNCTVAELREQHTKGRDGGERTKFKDFPPKVREHISRSIHYRRQAAKRLRSPRAVRLLFDRIAPRYLERPGGYLRVLGMNRVTLGDNSPRALLGFVEGQAEE